MRPASLPHTALDEHLVHCVRAEFLEMPGLQLTCEQAQRLWVIDRETCASVLNRLVDARFLVRRTDGRYVRCGDGQPFMEGLLPAKVERLGVPPHKVGAA